MAKPEPGSGSTFQPQQIKNAPVLHAQELQIHLDVFLALIARPRSIDDVNIDHSIWPPLCPLKYDSRPRLSGNT